MIDLLTAHLGDRANLVASDLHVAADAVSYLDSWLDSPSTPDLDWEIEAAADEIVYLWFWRTVRDSYGDEPGLRKGGT